MAGSIVVDCKRALVDLLDTRPGLAEVQVTFGWPGDDQAERERIFTGRAHAEHNLRHLSAGRTVRTEESTFDVVVQVEMVGGSPEDAEARVLELGLEVEETVADEKYLGGVPGLNWALVAAWDLSSLYNDKGSLAEIVYQIRFNARLT